MVQKTEHPAGLNKWEPLRVSNVLRPDNRVAGPWVGWAQWPWRVLFCVCPGSAVARSACCRAQWPWRVLGTVGAWHILRAAGLLLRVAYSVCGQALLLGAWPGPLAGCILRTVEAWRRGAYSVRGFGFSCLL